MFGSCRRQREKITALVAAALCSLTGILTHPASAAGSTSTAGGGGPSGLPGIPMTLTAGLLNLTTGLVTARLSNGANGPVLLTIGPCNPLDGRSCSGVVSEFALLGDFKDDAGDPLYSDAAPASVSWTCNGLVCPAPTGFVPGTRTRTQLQVQEFRAHTMYVAPRNPNGTFQPFAPAPACHGTDGATLPTGTIDRQATGGLGFCVDVGAITRGTMQCPSVCSAWSGPLTLPVLFVEDPKFMGT